jgi:hypothetical protein
MRMLHTDVGYGRLIGEVLLDKNPTSVCCMLTRMLTYADVCVCCMLTYADVGGAGQEPAHTHSRQQAEPD